MNENKQKEQQEKSGGLLRRIILAVGVAAGALALLYLAGSFFFAGHYFWRTRIGGTDVSFRSRERVREEFLNPEIFYELEITGREGMRDVLTPAELGMSYVFDDTLDRFSADMSGWAWPKMLFSDFSCELPRTVIYEEDELAKRLKGSPFFAAENIRKPQDAKMGGYEAGKGYSIIPEDPGTVLDFEKVMRAVGEALENLAESLDLTEGGFYSDAAVKSTDSALNRMLRTANRYAGAEITYLWNGETEVIDGSLISTWISFEENEVSLDEEAVREYVNGLAKKHDTFGREREFTATDGTLHLLKGTYGWWTNRAGETEALLSSIKKGEKLEKEPLYFSRGYAEGKAGEDIGDSYVEIDLGKQHLYLYIDGKMILESDFVSGSLARGHATPPGVFGLTYKERNATLTGETYATPVKYWMPFNGNIGMHDASWRREFGGDIYKRNGSHGCVNLPEEIAETIYGYVEQGFPVVCYD
ncbi:MAG TPA: L,D-transpeptidase/peptidoglycan binding protein [Candidatus Eisenbergiella merdavium]|uniref:L,D-transpeptidase/peptidoglycan binding protein n=1 Tax=Candidatus Eisenbergiella merdavium TaxID=2838551 RepID=A0A9D2SSN6_9FIRM|nr:L,D-transpeptidase/peptidoglycan binding protein [Candidatus Eisenbergiella merdavium]